MAEKTTIARPYAQAVFELAKADGDYAVWSALLEKLSLIVADATARKFIDNPRNPRATVADVVIDVLGKDVTDAGRNLIRVLAENRRLDVVAEMLALFEALRAEAEGTLKAQLVSAFEVDATQQQKIRDALSKRLGRRVELACEVDKALLGGAVIKAGDLVIDGSALGKIAKMANELEG